jgi:hypothetical protein
MLNCCRKYADQNVKGIFYPSSTDIIVIVERTDRPDLKWFPFELRLEWKLRVDVHGQFDALKFIRYMVRLGKHDGWCFHIQGNYKPNLAHKALVAALDTTGNISQIPPGVGLNAAVPAVMRMRCEYMNALYVICVYINNSSNRIMTEPSPSPLTPETSM